MKKFLYILALTFVTSLSFTSCTEEIVEPKQDTTSTSGGGSTGSGNDPIKP